MRKPVKLLKEMQSLVDKYVKHFYTDFQIDKDCILGTYSESQSPSGIYYWYLRESGTQLMSVENLAWKETSEYIGAEYWLPQAIVIYCINVKNQTLTPVSPAQMRTLLSRAMHMDTEVRLSFMIRRLEANRDGKASPNEALYSAANAYKLTEPGYIDRMIRDSRLTYDSAIARLTEIKLGLAIDDKKELF